MILTAGDPGQIVQPERHIGDDKIILSPGRDGPIGQHGQAGTIAGGDGDGVGD